jgi:hypothetical protein
MHGTLRKSIDNARQIERTLMQGTARLCSSPFGRACKGLWPHKTAETLASIVGCSVRAAGYELAGDREPSGRSIAAVVAVISKWPLTEGD